MNRMSTSWIIVASVQMSTKTARHAGVRSASRSGCGAFVIIASTCEKSMLDALTSSMIQPSLEASGSARSSTAWKIVSLSQTSTKNVFHAPVCSGVLSVAPVTSERISEYSIDDAPPAAARTQSSAVSTGAASPRTARTISAASSDSAMLSR